MSYTPINWQTGETITAEKLNKMDNGWGVQTTQLFNETVTTEETTIGPVTVYEAELTYSTPITAESITVVFNGNRYTCHVINITTESASGYGGVNSEWIYDFTEYPFAIVSSGNSNTIATQTAGTYTISVESNSIEISSDFNAAVNKCVPVDTDIIPMLCISGVTTSDEIMDAKDDMRMMYFMADSRFFYITYVTSNEIQFLPESSNVSASFENNVFTITVT